MPDEDFVLDRHAFTDEGMTRYLAPFADLGILLNLNKGADFAVIANLTAIEIDEIRELDVFPNLTSGAMQRYPLAATMLLGPGSGTGTAADGGASPLVSVSLPTAIPVRGLALNFFMYSPTGCGWL